MEAQRGSEVDQRGSLDGDQITLVIVKYLSDNVEENADINEFEQSLGSSLIRLGTITETIRRTNVCCVTGLRNELLACCNRCSTFEPIQYELLGISCSLDELKASAESCNMVVPIAAVAGLIPKSLDRHWILKKLREYIPFTREATSEVDTAKHYYRSKWDEKFDIMDEYTGTPFNSAQHQMLTANHLNTQYRLFKQSKPLSKSVWSKHVYKEAFMLHDETQSRELEKEWCLISPPLTKIRNYLGEKIAFAQAWRDCWVRWGLSVPAGMGLICFLYGLVLIVLQEDETNTREDHIAGKRSAKYSVNITNPIIPYDGSVGNISKMLIILLDNTLVPYYALFMCLWTALYVVKWHSLTKALQFEWGTSAYTLQDEHERPGYNGTPLEDVFENDALADGPRERCYRLSRMIVSLMVISLLIILVILTFLLSLFVKFKLREVLEPAGSKAVMYFWVFDANLISQIASGSTNALCIVILRQIFNRASYKLTVFEDHIFETEFERSLTWKLFAMDFLNTHFYNILVLFFRDIFENHGIFGISKERCDLCMHDDCITTVAINVFMILIVQGLGMPFITWFFYRFRMWDKKNITRRANLAMKLTPVKDNTLSQNRLRQIEKQFYFVEETLPGGTSSQYDRDYGTLLFMLKKLQLYSVVVMYAAACPLAPLLLIGFELGNHYRDRRKYTGNRYRRPAAQRSDGIGHWLSIQHLVNIIGVITNAFIIALQSSQGKKLFGVNWENYYSITTSTSCDPCNELVKTKHIGQWMLCVFLIVIFTTMTQFISTYFDITPVHLKIAMRREKYEINKKLKKVG